MKTPESIGTPFNFLVKINLFAFLFFTCICHSVVGADSISEEDSYLVPLVDGLKVSDPKKRAKNVENLIFSLKTLKDPVPLCKLLRGRVSDFKDNALVFSALMFHTNIYVEEITRELFLSARHENPQNCSKITSYITYLLQYEREEDVQLFLSEVKNHASHYSALEYNAWLPCESYNGTFGALVGAIMKNGNDESFAQLLDLYGGLEERKKQVMLAVLSRSESRIKESIRKIVTADRFRNLQSDVLKAVESPQSGKDIRSKL